MGAMLWTYYKAGGWAMHPITACSVVALAAILFKFGQLRTLRLDAGKFLGEVRRLLLNGKLEDAVAMCERTKAPLAAVVRAGLLKQGAPRPEVEASMEATALNEIDRLEAFLGLLATVVNLAPLLGFFGTVWGMIAAFDVIFRQGLANPAMVAGGVAQALYTTAWGLVVAFLTIPFHNWFAARVSRQSRLFEMAADTLLETYSEMDRMGTRA